MYTWIEQHSIETVREGRYRWRSGRRSERRKSDGGGREARWVGVDRDASETGRKSFYDCGF